MCHAERNGCRPANFQFRTWLGWGMNLNKYTIRYVAQRRHWECWRRACQVLFLEQKGTEANDMIYIGTVLCFLEENRSKIQEGYLLGTSDCHRQDSCPGLRESESVSARVLGNNQWGAGGCLDVWLSLRIGKCCDTVSYY